MAAHHSPLARIKAAAPPARSRREQLLIPDGSDKIKRAKHTNDVKIRDFKQADKQASLALHLDTATRCALRALQPLAPPALQPQRLLRSPVTARAPGGSHSRMLLPQLVVRYMTGVAARKLEGKRRTNLHSSVNGGYSAYGLRGMELPLF